VASSCSSWWSWTAAPPSAAAAASAKRAPSSRPACATGPPALAREVVRAFSTWFQSVNLAERVHRIRRRREYLLKDSQRPQPGGVEDAIGALKSQGLGAAQVLELIGSLSIEPVFAPHSTESSRRTLLRKQQRIAQRLLERLDPTLTPNEARNVWSSIRMELTRGVADRGAAARAAHGRG